MRWRLPTIVFALAAIVRLVYWLQMHESPFFLQPLIDAETYHELALDVAAGRWMRDDVFYQPPLYPYALGLLYSLIGPDIAVARLVQLLAGAFVCALIALLARRLYGPVAGWVAGGLSALHGPLIFYEGELLNPILVLGLNVAALLALLGCAHAPPAGWRQLGELPLRRLAVGGLLLGLSTLARSEIALFALLVAAGAVLGAPRRERLGRAALFAAAFLLPIVPTTAHNVIAGGEWVPISSNFGINFYLGNSGDYQASVGIRPGLAWRELNYEPLRAGVASEDRGGTSRWWTRRALAESLQDPAGWIAAMGRKAWLLVGAAEVNRNLDLRFSSRFTPLLLFLPGWGLLFPLAVAGLVVAWRRRSGAVLALYLATYVVTLLGFFVAGRFRLPMVPVLAIFAGLAVARGWALWRRDRRRVLAAVAAIVVLGAFLQWNKPAEAAVDQADGHYFLGKALAAAGEHEAAAVAYRRAIDIAQPHWDALFDLAGLEVERGAVENAARIYRQLLQVFPNDVESLVNLSQILAQTGRRRDALDLVDAAVARADAKPEVLTAATGLYLSSGRVEAATGAFRRLEASGYAREDLEILASRLSRQRAVRACLEAWLRRSPQEPQAASEDVRRRLEDARRRLALGEADEAERLLACAVARAPGSATAWEAVGKFWFLVGEGRPDAFRRALALDPSNADAHLGLAHSLAGDAASAHEAAGALREFLRHESEGPRADAARRALAGLSTAPKPPH